MCKASITVFVYLLSQTDMRSEYTTFPFYYQCLLASQPLIVMFNIDEPKSLDKKNIIIPLLDFSSAPIAM